MPKGEHIDQPDVEAEALIGRIIDREATPQDCEDFEQLASVDPFLWRTLALRHLDMAMLSDRVAEHTEAAEGVALPARRGGRLPLGVLVACSGWAAVLVVGLWWAIVAGGGRDTDVGTSRVQPVGEPAPAARELTADEHYGKYLEASFVVGEMDPVLLESEPLGDGRYRLRFIRRIEEYAVIERPPGDVADDRGHLTVDPAELRRGGAEGPGSPDS
jgi:hypothetical protein